MSKSSVGDVSMRTTPGAALRGEKPRRKYFSWLHVTSLTEHLEPKTCFILALYRIITSSAVLLKSQRLRGIFWMDSCPFRQRFELCNRVNNLRHRHTSKTHRVSRVCPKPGNVQGTCNYWSLARYTIGRCLDPKDRAGKWEEVNSAEYHRMLTSGPATTCIGFRAAGGQLKVRRLFASSVVDGCLNNIVESCILRAH